jgi:hypothetical protein
MFTRYTRRGECAHLQGVHYRLSKFLIPQLQEQISVKISSLIHEIYSNNRTKDQDSLMKKENYIIRKAIRDFYVITYDNFQQSFVDIQLNSGRIPKSTKNAFVFPAYYYLTNELRNDLKNYFVEKVKELFHPHKGTIPSSRLVEIRNYMDDKESHLNLGPEMESA